MFEKDYAILTNILDSINKILENTSNYDNISNFVADHRSFDATLMNFIVIGEMVGKLSVEIKEKNPAVDWRKIYAFRNVLAHDYFGIEEKQIWQIVQNDIPKLKNDIETIINTGNSNESK
ncbi:MAG: DUF86 domain-containing protein [Bacteroidia bacterium]|nr:DUF86 domain-containing protein [Bacteroidia bacterium]